MPKKVNFLNFNDINEKAQTIKKWALPKSDNHDLIITLCTNGYIDYVLNLMFYLKKLALDQNICIFCTDSFSQQTLQKYEIDTFLFSATWNPSTERKQVLYKGSGWKEVVATKIEIVFCLLQLGFNVIWTDGDVVWLKNPIEDLRRQIRGCDIAYQITGLLPDNTIWDQEMQKWKGEAPLDYTKQGSAPIPNMCAGFYYARSCSKTKHLFNPERIDPNTFLLEEHHLNPLLRADGIHVSMLHPRDYPNGKLWMSANNGVTDPFIIHYNYVSGSDKIAKMKEYGHWNLAELNNRVVGK